jgi:hypothetical protein
MLRLSIKALRELLDRVLSAIMTAVGCKYAVMYRPLSHWKPGMVFFPARYVYIIWRANGRVDYRRRGARADDATTSHAVLDGTIHDI